MNIPFNKPYLSGNELQYISDAVISGKISGDGKYTHKVHTFFETSMGLGKNLLTNSCTDALEMAAILCNIQPGDEVIAPAYTFVSSVNPFVMRGAKIVFCDSLPYHPNMDIDLVSSLITNKTKAIVVVHYAGVSIHFEPLLALAKQHNITIIEDAAQAINSTYNSKPLGTLGNMSAFSFHETKNIISGEGGLLVLNSDDDYQRAEILWEKGTNRRQFFRGEIDKYNWVDIGASFLPSDMIAAYLYAQLENNEIIQTKRLNQWNFYLQALSILNNMGILLPQIPNYAIHNGHIFYLVCESLAQREALLLFLKSKGIYATFHYQALHKSPFYLSKFEIESLPNSERFSDCLIRLPLYFELSNKEQQYIIDNVLSFFLNNQK